MEYFESRNNVRKVNRNYFEIYDQLSKDKHDFTPFKNQEEKMHKLEDPFLNKFIDQSNTFAIKEADGIMEQDQDFESKAFATQMPGQNTTSIDVDNNTSSQMINNYKEYEDRVVVPDNEMSRTRISRNAKVVLSKIKISSDNKRKEVKIDPKFNLPQGDPLENNLKVKDYDEDDSSDEPESQSQQRSPFVSKITSTMRTKTKTPTKFDATTKARDDKDFNIGIRDIIQESFGRFDANNVKLSIAPLGGPIREHRESESFSESVSKSMSSENTPSTSKNKRHAKKNLLPQLTNRNALQNNLVVPEKPKKNKKNRLMDQKDMEVSSNEDSIPASKFFNH